MVKFCQVFNFAVFGLFAIELYFFVLLKVNLAIAFISVIKILLFLKINYLIHDSNFFNNVKIVEMSMSNLDCYP